MANSKFLINNKAEQKLRITEKRQLITGWLASEQFSSCDILSQVIGLQGHGAHNTLKAMQRDGLLRSENLPTGASMQIIYSLTPHAAMLASDFEEERIVNYFEAGRVSPNTINHGLSLQKLRLKLTTEGWVEWRSDRECRRAKVADKWLNIPDAIANAADGQVVGIELERTYKSLKRYPDIIASHLQMIKRGHYSRVDYYCFGQVHAEKMQQIFNSVKEVNIKGQKATLQPEHHQKFQFFNIKE